MERIKVNPLQPRKNFDKSGLAELAESIKENGVIQPVIVREEGDNFILIAGERRLRAAEIAGFTRIPAVIKQVAEKDALLMALVENIQREDLNPIEEAMAYRELIGGLFLTQEQVAKRVGKSRVYVTNKLRLLKLPDNVKKMLAQGRLTEGQVRPLVGLKNDVIRKTVRKILKNHLNARQVEKLASRKQLKSRKKTGKIDPNLVPILNDLESRLGTKVNIHHSKGKGKIEIFFFSNEDLTRIYKIIKKN